MLSDLAERRANAATFHLREVHPNLRLGTASDRYGGWIGQVYPESWSDQITTSKKKVRGTWYEERKVPVAAVADFFQHFDCLELDFTFYTPLRGSDRKPTRAFAQLEQYADYAPGDAVFFVKAPHVFFARRFRSDRGGSTSYSENRDYLNAPAYVEQFLEPAQELLGDRLLGVTFQQEYQRVSDSVSPSENVAELDAFFSQVPKTVQSHIELRSPHLLTPEYFAWLESKGIGFVFSHWQWLPRLKKQWELCEGRFTAADGNVVVRLLTPLRMDYQDAWLRTYPFDKPVDDLVNSPQTREMILDTVALVYQAQKQDCTINTAANNRSYGNAPALNQAIAYRVLEEEERRM